MADAKTEKQKVKEITDKLEEGFIPTQPHYLSAKGLELLLRSVSKCSCTVKKQTTEKRDRPPAPHYSKPKKQRLKDKHCGNLLNLLSIKPYVL